MLDIEIQVKLENDTVWLTQKRYAGIVLNQSVISKHISNILKKMNQKGKQYAFFAYCKLDKPVAFIT